MLDAHGNTALHYLVGRSIVNWRAVEMLREVDEARFAGDQKARLVGIGNGIWNTARNRWGFTPKELFEAEQSRLDI